MPPSSPSIVPGSAPRRVLIRRWLAGTFSGRAIAAGVLVKVVAYALRLGFGAWPLFEIIDTAGDLALVAGALIVGYQLFVDAKRQLLWRVRRKLSLSYIFIGFVPALLIITFFLLCGLLLVYNFSAHMIRSRVAELQGETQLLAQMAAVALDPAAAPDVAALLTTRQSVAAARYPGVSYAVIPATNPCAGARQTVAASFGGTVTAGPWMHTAPPRTIPSWIGCAGNSGVSFYTDESRRSGTSVPGRLMTRAVAWPSSPDKPYAVVVDVPVNAAVGGRLRDDTGIELMEVEIVAEGDNMLIKSEPALQEVSDGSTTGGGLFSRRFRWLATFDWTSWESGMRTPVTVGIQTSIADIYERISPGEQLGSMTIGSVLMLLVAIVGGMFLIIQLVAFGMGLALARSITGSVHELFEGTERIRRGDFTGRIAIRSRDQLGELAESFNSMTASIEDLLVQKAEKERMEQELRIARSIQMSLLPQGPMTMPGVSVTAHCEPAREVGGDYYDFLPIDDHTVGILIADVSGKGTSAALYMAELKGIVLSLSQRHTSPRDLLIEADRIISRHLDSRSFITVTYLLVDLRARTLQYARAGHCPMIYMPGSYSARRTPQLITPDGLVLGLQLDGGQTFTRLLEEVTLPLGPGDLFVLYTDGMSEAMNPDGDCFGDSRLAALIGAHPDLAADELRERILRDIGAFAGTAAQHDDMTMVLLRVDEVVEAVTASV